MTALLQDVRASLGKVGVRAEAEWFDVSEVGNPFRATAGVTIGF